MAIGLTKNGYRCWNATSRRTQCSLDPLLHTMNATETSSNASNREKFVTLAEKRTTKALQAISVIGNLSNKSNYSYNEEDIKKIKKALMEQVNQTIGRFNAGTSKSNNFSLK